MSMVDDQQYDAGDDDNAIAIIGMACHLPGARNLDEFWQNLRDGVESVQFYSDQELLDAGETPEHLADPNYVRAQPALPGFDRFDAGFWGFNPQDAAVTDPTHRLFLEVAYQALEHAGHTGFDEEGTVGVFASSGASLYWMQNLQSNPELIEQMGEFLVRHTGNDMNFLATRLSYELDLKGPSVNVQTACSSGVVSIHSAVASLFSGECDLALAGASTVLVPQVRGYLYRSGEIMSPDGHCRPFDAQSAGTIFGSGAGAVVLRRLDDALAEGDRVLAVIRGSAINNDGAAKVGYLAPGVEGQAAVIAEALAVSGISAEQVGYVEAHGTGTLVGDPIEIEALKQVFQEATDNKQFCQVGSVKANIGHLGEAAGMASVIKAVLSLQHRQIPPVPNFRSPNPEMDIGNSPFRIATTLDEWRPIAGRTICGVTSLGAGGTNAHLILESADSVQSAPEPFEEVEPQLLLLSARSEAALRAGCQQLGAHLESEPDLNLRDAAYTLALGRRSYEHRAALVAGSTVEASAVLREGRSDQMVIRQAPQKNSRLVFLLPGGGAQYAGMGAQLYAEQPAYARAFDAAMACLPQALAETLRELVLAPAADRAAATVELERPSLSLPALFATEYALAQLLQSWGARPDALIGHSMGENTAACLSGVLSLADGMALVAKRGELFEGVAAGAMLSVSLAPADLRPHLKPGVDLAALNASELCVASGPVQQIDALQTSLTEADVQCTRIHINVAAHSAMLDGILAEFEAFCRTLTLRPPSIPFTSNLTGTWITDEQATDPGYWASHLRNTVLFAENIATVNAGDAPVMVEIGPGRTLTSLARAGGADSQRTFSSMRHPTDNASDVAVALGTIGSLWACGVSVDWQSCFEDSQPRRLPLPGYAFQRQRYWVEPGASEPVRDDAPRMHKRQNVDDWFGLHSWAQTGRPRPHPSNVASWLFFAESDDRAAGLLAALRDADSSAKIIQVERCAAGFEALNDGGYRLNPEDPDAFEALFAALAAAGTQPEHIVYGWPAQGAFHERSEPLTMEAYERDEALYFWGLFHLARQLCDLDRAVQLSVLTSRLFGFESQPCQVTQALLMGPVTVLPHEAPHVTTRLIDLHPDQQSDRVGSAYAGIVQELLAQSDDRVVMLNRSGRWIRSLQPSYLPPALSRQSWIRKGGTYLISGGLGGIGLTVAQHLARHGAARICLLGRTGLPERSEWPGIQADAQTKAYGRIAAVQAMERAGAQVLIVTADVSDEASLRHSLSATIDALDNIDGVIHAAGAMDDQLMMVKSAESARAVLQAKVRGAIVLDRLFADVELDFFVLFSSIASHMGLPGQVDYSAANAFLDALALARRVRARGYTAVLNWNAWREVGMAAETAASQNAADTGPAILPARALLQVESASSETGHCYEHAFSVATDWLAAEHRVRGGHALLSGTSLLELGYQAYSRYLQNAGSAAPAGAALELRNLEFIEAFRVSDGQSAVCQVELRPADKHCEVLLYSGNVDAPNATCAAATLPAARPAALDVSRLQAECVQSMPTDGRFLAQSFMDFGQRWGCIDQIGRSATEPHALLALSLPAQFNADLAHHPLHPALMDMATGGAQFLIPGFDSRADFYVPVRYERIVVHAPLVPKIFSYVRCLSSSEDLFARFDVTIADPDGNVLLEVEGFSMKRIDPDSLLSGEVAGPVSAAPPYAQLTLTDILRYAIAPSEGLDALDRVMTAQDQPQYVISSVDTNDWLESLDNHCEAELDASGSPLQFVHEDRIDPDAAPEIAAAEVVLLKLPAVTAIAIRCFGAESDVRPVAFVESAEESLPLQTLDLALQQAGLSMRIAAVVQPEALPRTPEGGVDRVQCVDPLESNPEYDAPQGATEEKLEPLWASLLGMPRVGRNDNFFELGGHSLLLTRLISRVQKAFARKLPLEEAYQNPTLSAWAQLLERIDSSSEPVKRIGRVDRSKFKVN